MQSSGPSRSTTSTLFTTQQSADDLDLVRRELGIERWNLWGGSYGAELAVEVMRRHPDAVRSAIIDSALPDFVDVLAAWPDVRREKLDALFDACATDSTCSDRFGDLEPLLDRTLGDLERDPVTVDGVRVGRTKYSVLMDDARALLAVLIALGDTNSVPHLPALLADAANGRLDDLAPFAIAAGPNSFAEALHWSNRCTGRWARSDPTAGQRAAADETGAYLDVFSTGWIVDRCKQLPIEFDASADSDSADAHVDVPTVVMAGGLDPNQSADWAARLADGLGNATLLKVEWIGHTVGFAVPCGRTSVESFLADPSSPAIACDPEQRIEWSSNTR